ncbi:PGN_0703 family putative restriction endonuclease [Methylocystis echinoides]|uniref:PD-(D/E)XK nuclease-like domain-containing protein n=1 Tax=Methylocystis echinoides TaxID=29468 RepID=A0A9W6GXJ7_9HYPH|nr:hypothetical protein [Methylocystis echinoides]GLI94665.1 hypothetical protein LMG27198_36570 [Methylocystis echinoides]
MAPEFDKPFQQLPIIPTHILKKHRVHEPLDTRFRSAARLLQALWRQDRGLPPGSYVGEDGKPRKLGSRITEKAGMAGGNFLTAEIAHLAWREVAYREIGAMMDEGRLKTNLLSSMALTFNLIAPLALKRSNSDALLYELLQNFRGATQHVLFEHSPGRRDPRFTGDYSAFDALIRYVSSDGRRGFVAIEVKYSESMNEPVPRINPRYGEFAEASGLFAEPKEPALRSNPLQQLWREHLLAQSMIDAGLYDEGYFLLIAPALNYHAQEAATAYQAQLCEPAEGRVIFANVTLEQAIDAIRYNDPSHAEALYRRYCDFWAVDGELELNAPIFGARAKAHIVPVNAISDDAEALPDKLAPRRKANAKKRGAAAAE